MEASVERNRSFLSLVPISFLVLLFLVLLVVPTSAAFTGATNQPGSTVTNSIVVQKDTQYAGYEIYSNKAGSTLNMQGTYIIPTVTCTANSFFEVYLLLAHTYSQDVGSQLYVVCTGAGATADYSLSYSVSANFIGVGFPVYPGDVIKTTASENPMTGATYLTLEDATSGHSFFLGQAGSVPLNSGYGGLFSWVIYSTPSSSLPVPAFTPIKFSGVKATIDGHTGNLGLFTSIKGISVYQINMFNPVDKHVLVKASPIGSASKSFNLKWVTAI
jgi:hypothetical protein